MVEPATQHALWRRLDTSGHDAAQLTAHEDGWILRGVTVFLKDKAPTCLGYRVEIDAGWSTRRAEVRGFCGEREITHIVERADGRWTHNGARIVGLDGVADIDFGFTPATNMPQLRRIGLDLGQEAAFSVAWLDVDTERLIALPQRYRRVSELWYDYASPVHGYQASLMMAPNGFIAEYPELWILEPDLG